MDFKYLRNPTDTKLTFQYDSEIFEVEPFSKVLLPAHIADHGERRSFMLTDPQWDEEGNLVSSGNAVIKIADTEPAVVKMQVGAQQPILFKESPDPVGLDASAISVSTEKTLQPTRRNNLRQGDAPKSRPNPSFTPPHKTEVKHAEPDSSKLDAEDASDSPLRF